jgi:hypothetical protein
MKGQNNEKTYPNNHCNSSIKFIVGGFRTGSKRIDAASGSDSRDTGTGTISSSGYLDTGAGTTSG